MNQNTAAYQRAGMILQIRPDFASDKKAVDEVLGGGYRRTRPFKFDVERGDRWIDLGAMIGAFSAYALTRGAHVTAVEPDPDHVRVLKMNAPEAKIIAGAVVTDDRKAVTLHRNDARGNTWRNSIMRTWKGGSEIDVPTIHIASLFPIDAPVCVKMDIEGMEMPILEYLLQHPREMKKIDKLVFEWSFDVDADLDRFRRVMRALMQEFPNVAPDKLYEGTAEWPSSWFPACTTIFCKR